MTRTLGHIDQTSSMLTFFSSMKKKSLCIEMAIKVILYANVIFSKNQTGIQNINRDTELGMLACLDSHSIA